MSTFDGIIREIPGISVDNFEGVNLQSHAFFLSHYHTDHINGMHDNSFIARMYDHNVFLYASPITVAIIKERIKNDYSGRYDFQLKELQNYEPVIIDVLENEVKVTTMPAGHCMGSVMFLFETYSNTILYTGDFRLDPEVFRNMPPLLIDNKLKRIDNIYLDTTFFNEDFKVFPKRTELLPKIITQINDWIKADEINNVIYLWTPGYYNYECVFREIWKELKRKVYVPNKLAIIYKYLPELDDVITENIDDSNIIVTTMFNLYSTKKFDKCIKLSAFRFQNSDVFCEKSHFDNIMYTCYSTHASYNEIKEILYDLKPLKITPCVAPENYEKILTVMINDILESIHLEKPTNENELTFKLNQVYDYDNTPTKNRSDDLLGSPPRELIRKNLFYDKTSNDNDDRENTSPNSAMQPIEKNAKQESIAKYFQD